MVDKSTKHLIDDLKQFFMREITTVYENMKKKFDELTQNYKKWIAKSLKSQNKLKTIRDR